MISGQATAFPPLNCPQESLGVDMYRTAGGYTNVRKQSSQFRWSTCPSIFIEDSHIRIPGSRSAGPEALPITVASGALCDERPHPESWIVPGSGSHIIDGIVARLLRVELLVDDEFSSPAISGLRRSDYILRGFRQCDQAGPQPPLPSRLQAGVKINNTASHIRQAHFQDSS